MGLQLGTSIRCFLSAAQDKREQGDPKGFGGVGADTALTELSQRPDAASLVSPVQRAGGKGWSQEDGASPDANSQWGVLRGSGRGGVMLEYHQDGASTESKNKAWFNGKIYAVHMLT